MSPETSRGPETNRRPAGHRVVVVGAGPAGSVTALALARRGVSVLLLDRSELPRWKVCGGCLGPAAMSLLDRLGLAHRVRQAGALPLQTMALQVGGHRARLPLGRSVSLSRFAFDSLLAAAVTEAGGDVRFGVRVEGLAQAGEGVELRLRENGAPRRLRAHVVVDATGLGGLHLANEGAAEDVSRGSRLGLGAVFPAAAAHDCPEGELRMVVGRSGYVGMVRTEDGSVDVAAAVDRELVAEVGPGAAVTRILGAVGARLPDGAPSFGWRGTPALTRRSLRPAEDRIFRVGDAAGYVEPFTGEGMGWAMAGGVAAAVYVEEGLADNAERAARGWIGAHARIVQRRQRVCRWLARGLRHPWAARAAVQLLATAPGLARPLMDATGRVAPEALAAAEALATLGALTAATAAPGAASEPPASSAGVSP